MAEHDQRLSTRPLRQVSHDDKGATAVSFLEAVDVSQPARVQQVRCCAAALTRVPKVCHPSRPARGCQRVHRIRRVQGRCSAELVAQE